MLGVGTRKDDDDDDDNEIRRQTRLRNKTNNLVKKYKRMEVLETSEILFIMQQIEKNRRM